MNEFNHLLSDMHQMHRLLFSLSLFLFVTSATPLENEFKSLHSPSSWADANALRKGDYSQSLQKILMDSLPHDTLLNNFKLAVIYYKLKNYSTALSLFRKVINQNPDLTPAVYMYIAEIELELDRPGNALAAYRSVLRSAIPQRLRTYIFSKLQPALAADSSFTLEQAPWLEEYYRWLPGSSVAGIDSTLDSLLNFLTTGNFSSADTLIADISLTGIRASQLAGFIDTFTNSTFLSCRSLYAIAQAAHRSGKTSVAEKLYDNLHKKPHVYDTLSERLVIKSLAELMYDRQDWHEAIKWYRKLISRFGNDPDILFTIARAYRKLEKNHDAAQWYDRLLAAYPRHPKAEEIVWLRAWQFEDKNHYAQAGALYRSIYTKYKKGTRVDESYLRHGLCLYRQKKYDSAAILFETLEDRLPQSSYIYAAQFWRAKTYLAQKKNEDALLLLRLVSYKEPFDYYAHRSRTLLLEMKDTAHLFIDTTIHDIQIITWLDSLSAISKNRKSLTFSDSLSLLCGMFLAFVGDVEKADFFIGPIENAFPGNLTLQYAIINMYTAIDASAQAYRAARRLTWRIPQECRAELPLKIYSLFYPSFYHECIVDEAKKHSLPPALVSGIIRQESIFDPGIVSPAGAVGLMQIMPATGKTIGEKLSAPFSVDSLYNPYYNIRFGVYYISELLKQFEGNPVLALCGYNAGPHNAKRWERDNRHKEPDLFVEDIGFSETRGYVKKVMANFWTYQILNSYYASWNGKNCTEIDDSLLKTSENQR